MTKITIFIDEERLEFIDVLVKANKYTNRSNAIQSMIDEARRDAVDPKYIEDQINQKSLELDALRELKTKCKSSKRGA